MKYGVENVFQIDDVKNRIKEVNMKNLGVEYPTQSETIKNKIKEMNIIKYGVENVGQYNEVKNKIKKTNLEKYGVEYSFQSDNVKNKIKKTNLEKYGVEYSSQNKENRKKYKETCLKKYGVDNVSKSEKIKKKKEEISIERYGVNHVSQDPNIYMKQQKSGYRLNLHENTKLIYRGSYERDFLDFCFCNDIQISQGKRIKYFYENDIHYYFSDYYLESLNLIIEIKSSWTYNKYLNKNLAKEKATINSGYYYLVIKDKNYDEFKKFLEKKSEHFNINI